MWNFNILITECKGVDGPEIESGGGEIFHTRPERNWGPRSLLYHGYRVFPGGKPAGSWRWPPNPSSCEEKERVDLYLYSPSGLSWPVLDWTLPFIFTFQSCIGDWLSSSSGLDGCGEEKNIFSLPGFQPGNVDEVTKNVMYEALNPHVVYCMFKYQKYIKYTYLLTHSIQQSPSWEANLFAASQEIPHILRNPKVHYRIHKCPQPVSNLSQLKPLHTPTSYVMKTHLNINFPPTSGSPQWSLSLRFPHQTSVHASPPSPIRATCPAHLILLDFITRTIVG
jgi:hypothetical protein